MRKHVTDYLLYRWRYLLGYGIIGALFIVMLAIAGLYIPGGVSEAEMASVVMTGSLSFSLDSFDPQMIVNLPYHLLQWFSVNFLGVTAFSIKLPSLLLGLLSGIGMLLLLRTWFKENVAVITTILTITTGQFLFVAQSGTPSILYIFWSVWLLVAAMFVSRRVRFSGLWKIVLFGIAALSLYTPLSLYILLALTSAALLHPHLRFLIRRLPKVKVAIAAFCGLALLTPLIYAIVLQPSVAWTLLGIPNEWPDWWANLILLFKPYIDFITPSSGVLMTPIYGLGSMVLVALGIYRLFTTKYTARSYIIIAWTVLLLPILLINPEYRTVTFVPIMLLLAMGISTLLTSWYRLFPRNPYARLAGLVPLAVLIGGMVFTGIDRYAYGYLYDPQTASNFSNDLTLLRQSIKDEDKQVHLVTSESLLPFYEVVARHRDNLEVTMLTKTPPNASVVVIGSDARTQKLTKQHKLDRIVTDATHEDADRFYIYKTTAK